MLEKFLLQFWLPHPNERELGHRGKKLIWEPGVIMNKNNMAIKGLKQTLEKIYEVL